MSQCIWLAKYLSQQSAVQGRREVVSASCSNYLYLSVLFALSSGATLTIFGWPRQRSVAGVSELGAIDSMEWKLPARVDAVVVCAP